MNPAEKYARLRLLEHAVRAALPGAAAAAEEYRESVRAKSLETDYGTVSVVRPKRVAYIADPDAFLAWVQEHRPDEIVHSVRPSFAEAYLAELGMDSSGECFDRDGEIVPWAASKMGRPHLRVALDAETKRAAAGLVAEQIETWALPEVEQ